MISQDSTVLKIDAHTFCLRRLRRTEKQVLVMRLTQEGDTPEARVALAWASLGLAWANLPAAPQRKQTPDLISFGDAVCEHWHIMSGGLPMAAGFQAGAELFSESVRDSFGLPSQGAMDLAAGNSEAPGASPSGAAST